MDKKHLISSRPYCSCEASKEKFTGVWSGGGLPNPTKLWHIFSSCDNVTKKTFPIINGGGIPWQCNLNFVDGGSVETNKKSKTVIELLLCDALNGWKY